MGNAVIRQAGYILAHTPDLLKWHGSAILQARHKNPDEPWLSEIPRHLRSFDQAVNYPPASVLYRQYQPCRTGDAPQTLAQCHPGGRNSRHIW